MSRHNRNSIIELRDVSVSYDRPVLSDINLEVDRGDFVAITGPNGGGKTTLLRAMLRLIAPSKGQVLYFSREGKPVKKLAIGYLPQKNMIDSRFPVTVEEVVLSGLYRGLFPRITESDRSRLEETISEIGAESFRRNPIGELSGGQLQRALLGRAIISRPEVLVLDEPLSYVDKSFERRIYSLMEELARTTTIILVSHEMSVIAGMATKHLIVDHKLHICRSASHYLESPCSDAEQFGEEEENTCDCCH